MKANLLLKPAKLLTHPKNMRRFYPAHQVREMANSIAACKGVLQPLIIVKSNEPHKYFVVDGNMRLAAARLLEASCPRLECKVVDKDAAEQMLSMVVANTIRYDVDPVSEALHYKALIKEGYSQRDISKMTGVYEARITLRLPLAELEEFIQRLIVDGKLPADHRAVKALLSLPKELRLKVAKRLSERPGLKIATVVQTCENIIESQDKKTLRRNPGSELSGAKAGGSAKPADLRSAAQQTCKTCNQYEGKLAKLPEPAWASVVHAADETCGGCSLKDVQNVCGSCPVVVMLKKLVGKDSA
jgi:ParB/RepB/Spo0J family partition protein